jgi:hypothetical protein
MLKGSRFIWFFWTQCLEASLIEKEESWEFQGEISAFRFLFGNCTHSRKIVKIKGSYQWTISDQILNVPDTVKAYQIWNSDNFDQFKIVSDSVDYIKNEKLEKGFFSEFYGEFSEVKRLSIPFNLHTVKTTFAYKYK